VAGGLFPGTFSRARRHGWMVIGAVVVWGAAIAGFGLSGSLWLAVAFLAVAGVADMVSMVFRGAILLSAATDEMRGRMQGVFIVVVAGGPRLGDLRAGATAAALGATISWVGGGLLAAALVSLALLVPALRNYDARAPHPEAEEATTP
jgi:MFS family permease